MHPDSKKITAMSDMPAPTNRQQLLSFLSLATYMEAFIPNLNEKTALLRDLTKKNAILEWNASHQQAFDVVKNVISVETTIRCYDPHRPITLQVDASTTGLGATLIQDGGRLAFASRALTETESHYANIEREMLAVIFGCEQFHHFLFGQEVKVEPDHMSLKSIHVMHLHSAPARLRCMLLQLQPYDIVIKYQPGSNVSVADTLLWLLSEYTACLPDMDVQILDIHPLFTGDIINCLKTATQQDEELTVLREVIFLEWPDQRKEAPTAVQGYWDYRDEFAIADG